MAKKKVVDDPATPEDESLVAPTVEEAAATLAEAKAELAAAEAKHKEALAASEAAAGKAADEALDPTKHVILEGVGPVEFPEGSDVDKAGRCRARTLTLGGVNTEHVGDKTYQDAEDVTQNVWIYRRM